MRVLLLFRGAPGSGKSTTIEKENLGIYALSADELRMRCQSLSLDPDGNDVIGGDSESKTWEILFELLEHRMSRGEFTVIDATNSKTVEMNKYKALANKYRYRIYCMDFTGLPIEECKRRNLLRPSYKQVPEETIDRMYSRFATQNIPSGIKTIKDVSEMWYRPVDLSDYKAVNVIGDIHGCFSVLNKLVGEIKEDEYYIFCGDYLDRGIENRETLKFLLEIYKKPNVCLLEGNHEIHLRNWASNLDVYSREFRNKTLEQIGDISKKAVRELCRRFAQCSYFTYHGKEVLVSHGGISRMPECLTLIATKQMIDGVGRYGDAERVTNAFNDNSKENQYQVFGHRNVTGEPIQTGRVFNLEGSVERGGQLRCVAFRGEEIETFEIQNEVYKLPDDISIPMDKEINIEILVEYMRASKYIEEKEFGDISSFNFSKFAFNKQIWDGMTVRARGLYINTVKNEIVARGYPKFFNLHEHPSTDMLNLKETLVFPLTAYVKENGYLGIMSSNDGELFTTSKSALSGEHSELFRKCLYDVYGHETVEKMREFAEEHNVTLLFEVCDPVNDPHIIKYDKTEVILLDAVHNDLEGERIPYEQMKAWADDNEIRIKEKACTINSWKEFCEWEHDISDEKYNYHGKQIEGFVVEDDNGFMFKKKLFWYNMWKFLRMVAKRTLRCGNIAQTAALQHPEANYFYGWCREWFNSLERAERIEMSQRDIISLREQFWKERGEK